MTLQSAMGKLWCPNHHMRTDLLPLCVGMGSNYKHHQKEVGASPGDGAEDVKGWDGDDSKCPTDHPLPQV